MKERQPMPAPKGFIQWANGAQTACFYRKGNNVYRAPLSNAVDTDGYLQGRWECEVPHWNYFATSLNRVLIADPENP